MQYKVGEQQSKSNYLLCIKEKGDDNILIGDVMERVTERMKSLKWGKIEFIIRDAKVTQINTIDEERL